VREKSPEGHPTHEGLLLLARICLSYLGTENTQRRESTCECRTPSSSRPTMTIHRLGLLHRILAPLERHDPHLQAPAGACAIGQISIKLAGVDHR